MNKRFILALEIIWIITGSLSLFIAIRSLFLKGIRDSLLFFLLAAVSFFFAWLRHRQRGSSQV